MLHCPSSLYTYVIQIILGLLRMSDQKNSNYGEQPRPNFYKQNGLLCFNILYHVNVILTGERYCIFLLICCLNTHVYHFKYTTSLVVQTSN
jgi:hypothetical protein